MNGGCQGGMWVGGGNHGGHAALPGRIGNANANFFILPIIRRKDMSNEIIDVANEIIISECEKFEAITLIKKFVPSEDMLFDNVHLNNKKGLPENVTFPLSY
jgi:hypothetical protein